MAIYLELPVYKVCYELYIEFVKVRRTLPREERYTIGQELGRAMVDTLVLLQRINATRDKVPLIGRARQLVAEIQIRTRVLKDVKALSVGRFTTLFDLSESVSKQLASWQKFSQKQVSDANVPSCRDGWPESAGLRFGGVRQKANPMRNDAASFAHPDNGDPTANNNRNNGQSVRPVRELAAAPSDGASHRLLEDLYRAYLAARRHKRGKAYQIRFEMNQERELVRLRDELLERRYEPRPSTCFIIHDPKMREVFAAEFRDRIVHHLFYNYTHEIFERTFITDSYSCIEGKGTHYGIGRLAHHIRSCSQNWRRPCFILKLDVKGYFMHIDRRILQERCREILVAAGRRGGDSVFGGANTDFVDYLLEKICLFDPLECCRIVGDTTEWKSLPKDKSLFWAKEGCGLPIGNLSSQLFSNIYLGILDDFVKRELKVKHYGRYVDDIFIVGESRDYVKALIAPIRTFLRDRLKLKLSENKTRICDARQGVEFLGAYIKPFRSYVSSRSLRRIRNHLHAVTPRMRAQRAQAVVNSSLGVLSHYDSFCVRKLLISKSRLLDFGSVSQDWLRFYPNAMDWRLYKNFKKGTQR